MKNVSSEQGSIRSFHEEVAICACKNKFGVRRLVCKNNNAPELYCVWEEITCENCKNKYKIEHYIEPSDEITKMTDAILVLKDIKIDKNNKGLISLAHHLKFEKRNRG